jgi:hypothetical protein
MPRARSIERPSQADSDERLDLIPNLHRSEDQEEYDSWVRAIEELVGPPATGTEPFPWKTSRCPPA